MQDLRQSTASQIISLGQFLDSIDGDTEENGLTIANTDIKLRKNGATTLVNKNSGGATNISNGVYHATLNATDSNTLGRLEIYVHVAGALAVKAVFRVLTATAFDAIYTGTFNNLGGTAQTGDNFARIGVNGAGLTNIDLPNQTFDLTGNITGNLSGSVGSLTTNNDKTGYSLTQSFPSNFASMVISGAGATDSLIQGYLNTLIAESTAGNIAANFDNFYDNGDALTTKIVDDVGVGSLFPSAGWLWSTATSGVPNPGRIRGNNATIASITELSIHRETDDGRDAGIVISALRSGDRIGIFFEANPDVFLIFDVTATPILTGSVFAVTGTVDSSAGTFVNTSVTVGYQITGNAAAAVVNRQEMDSNSIDLNSLISGQSTINTKLDDIQGATFSGATDSLEAIRNRGDIAWLTATGFNTVTPLDAAGTRAALGLATANMDVQFAASVTATGFNTVVPDAAGVAPTVAEILAGGDIDGFSLEESHKLILAASVGILAGAATNSITIQAADGSKTRITATVDADGNRSVVVKDVTG